MIRCLVLAVQIISMAVEVMTQYLVLMVLIVCLEVMGTIKFLAIPAVILSMVLLVMM